MYAKVYESIDGARLLSFFLLLFFYLFPTSLSFSLLFSFSISSSGVSSFLLFLLSRQLLFLGPVLLCTISLLWPFCHTMFRCIIVYVLYSIIFLSCLFFRFSGRTLLLRSGRSHFLPMFYFLKACFLVLLLLPRIYHIKQGMRPKIEDGSALVLGKGSLYKSNNHVLLRHTNQICIRGTAGVIVPGFQRGAALTKSLPKYCAVPSKRPWHRI